MPDHLLKQPSGGQRPNLSVKMSRSDSPDGEQGSEGSSLGAMLRGVARPIPRHSSGRESRSAVVEALPDRRGARL